MLVHLVFFGDQIISRDPVYFSLPVTGNQDAMDAAVRVLNAMVQCQEPDFRDIEILQRLRVTSEKVSPEELACEVIQLAIRARTAVQRSKIQ